MSSTCTLDSTDGPGEARQMLYAFDRLDDDGNPHGTSADDQDQPEPPKKDLSPRTER
jgi:hypothetical protein